MSSDDNEKKIKLKTPFKSSKIYWLALNGFFVPKLNFNRMISIAKSSSCQITISPPLGHSKKKEMEILYLPAGMGRSWQYWPNEKIFDALFNDAFKFYAPVGANGKIDLYLIDGFAAHILSNPKGWCARVVNLWEIIYVPTNDGNLEPPQVLVLNHINDYDAMLALYKSNRRKDLFGPRKKAVRDRVGHFAEWWELPKIPICASKT